MTAPVTPPPPIADSGEPAISTGVVASVIAGFAVLVVMRLNRQFDLFNADEFASYQTLVTLVAPIAAAWFIRSRVVPLAKHEQVVQYFTAAGYAAAVEEDKAKIEVLNAEVDAANLHAEFNAPNPGEHDP